jgi:hypothetical protein
MIKYELDGIDSILEGIFLFSIMSRLAPRATELYGSFSSPLGIKQPGHLHLVPRPKVL